MKWGLSVLKLGIFKFQVSGVTLVVTADFTSVEKCKYVLETHFEKQSNCTLFPPYSLLEKREGGT